MDVSSVDDVVVCCVVDECNVEVGSDADGMGSLDVVRCVESVTVVRTDADVVFFPLIFTFIAVVKTTTCVGKLIVDVARFVAVTDVFFTSFGIFGESRTVLDDEPEH